VLQQVCELVWSKPVYVGSDVDFHITSVRWCAVI
jgi:hypothetical protein